MNNPTKEHLDNVAFVAKFKEANKATKYESVYDPIKRIRVMKPISIDPNVYKFAEENIVTASQAKRKSKNGVTSSAKNGKSTRGYHKNPAVKQNVVRLHNEGKSFEEIAKIYGVSKRTVYRTYSIETKNEDTSNVG